MRGDRSFRRRDARGAGRMCWTWSVPFSSDSCGSQGSDVGALTALRGLRGYARILQRRKTKAKRIQLSLSRLHAATGPRKSARFRVIRGKVFLMAARHRDPGSLTGSRDAGVHGKLRQLCRGSSRITRMNADTAKGKSKPLPQSASATQASGRHRSQENPRVSAKFALRCLMPAQHRSQVAARRSRAIGGAAASEQAGTPYSCVCHARRKHAPTGS